MHLSYGVVAELLHSSSSPGPLCPPALFLFVFAIKNLNSIYVIESSFNKMSVHLPAGRARENVKLLPRELSISFTSVPAWIQIRVFGTRISAVNFIFCRFCRSWSSLITHLLLSNLLSRSVVRRLLLPSRTSIQKTKDNRVIQLFSLTSSFPLSSFDYKERFLFKRD